MIPFITPTLEILYRSPSIATSTLLAYHHHDSAGRTLPAYRLVPSVFAHMLHAAESLARRPTTTPATRESLTLAIANAYDCLCRAIKPEVALRLHGLKSEQWDALRRSKPLPQPPELPSQAPKIEQPTERPPDENGKKPATPTIGYKPPKPKPGQKPPAKPKPSTSSPPGLF